MTGGTVIRIKKDGTVRVIGIPRWIYPLAGLVGLAAGLLIGLL